jgi:hypothetical protein
MLVQAAAFDSKVLALVALHQPHPALSIKGCRDGAGLSLAQSYALRTLRIYGYASAFLRFKPCYAGKFEN